MERELTVVGNRMPMLDAAAKAKGTAQFIDDLVLPGMLHGKILRSPLPHAKILHIDTSKAEKLSGVKGVMTGTDIPDRKYGIVPKAKDEYALAKTKVRYIGDEVAAVCAVDPEIAEEALELIKVDYEELPAVFDPMEAIKEGAPLVHADVQKNISASIRKEFGDVEKAFGESDFIFEDTFYSQAVNHAPLEPHGALAQYDPKGELTIWSSTQIPFFLRRNLSTTLLVPESKLRVIKPKVGGGFGQKVDMFAKDFCACWFAMNIGRPVKFIYDREEVFIGTRQRHPVYLSVKTGLNKEGNILAQQFKAYADGGAYNSTAPVMITLMGFFLMIPYKVPNLLHEGYHVYTNKPVGGAMRGHGIPQARFAVERQLDMIAERMDLDPGEIRIRNSIHAGEPHPAKFVINTCGFVDTVKKAAEGIGWAQKRGKLPFGRGVGMAGGSFPSGVSNMSHISSGAVVQLGREGAVNVLTGAADIGQGAETVIGQIVAEELGVLLEDVRVTAADTGITPLDPGTFGSGVTVRAGNAARLAAISVKNKLFEIVSEKLEASVDDLVAEKRKIYVKGSPDKGMTLSDALKAYQYGDHPMPIVGRGSWMAPTTEPTTLLKENGNFAPNYSFMTQAAEVEVDPQTGRVKLLKMAAAHDCGKMINPLLVEGQLEGSVVGGMGQALYEDVIVEKGQVMNPSFLDYGFPTAMEMPEIEAIEVETIDPLGPFGAKEAGEGTQVSPAPAIVNAIYDAIGIDFMEMPVTPEKILKALEEKKK
ncbi:MAG: molybdopterin-dependent oxidoreductase [Nitrospinaceae bacterium]|jgi:4-hydroxybenzoyl-CoA reductase subunit alpha|nr:molybdopterin-dependent oxidoreductase [Nitrospinaceae bacterium]|tara:strand:+ start:12113 stop:14392 length:2280 start_codon:yes stop_codon:yes gene_type:complete